MNISEINKQIELLQLKKQKIQLEQTKILLNKELINIFLKSIDSENTRKAYFLSLKLFERFIESKNFQYVTKLDLENYFNFLNDSNQKKHSKQLRFNSIVSFYKHLFYLQEIDPEGKLNLHFIENPIINIKRKWKNNDKEKEVEILTNEEIIKVLKVLSEKERSFRNFLMFYILADTSMRVNGMLNIEAENINFENRIIETLDKGKWRKYCFGENLKKILQEYLKIRPRIENKHNNSKYLIFSKYADKMIVTSYYNKNYPKELIKEMTGKNTTPHSLRRSFKTNRTNLGQLREQIEALMNHKTGLDNSYNRPEPRMFLKWFDDYEQF